MNAVTYEHNIIYILDVISIMNQQFYYAVILMMLAEKNI
jgi:hypothetical protein